MSNWISVKEKLPKDGDWVLAYYGGYRGNIITLLQWKHGAWFDFMGIEEPFKAITHWMPLPEMLEEDE